LRGYEKPESAGNTQGAAAGRGMEAEKDRKYPRRSGKKGIEAEK